MPLIRVETLIHAPRDACFDLMRDASAHTRSVAHTKERAVAGRIEGLFEAGDDVTWEAWHLGFRLRMTVRVTRCDRPDLFEDEMVRGPFASFKHVHRFLAEDAVTRMIDEFDYRAPLGLLGRIADFIFLERYMRRLLETRARALKDMAERTGTPHGST